MSPKNEMFLMEFKSDSVPSASHWGSPLSTLCVRVYVWCVCMGEGVCVCVVCDEGRVCERKGERECEKESVWEEGRGKERMCIIEKQYTKRMKANMTITITVQKQ